MWCAPHPAPRQDATAISGHRTIGHRGARGLFPENTLEGFHAAWAQGVRHFELDVGVTRDRVAVVHHDPALNPEIARGPDGAWLAARGPLLRDLDFAALREFDVGRIRPGSRTAALFPDQAPADGARIPALETVLRALPEAWFLIELKCFPDHRDWTAPPDAMVQAMLAAIRAAGALDRVMGQSFDWHAVRLMRDAAPGLPRSWLTEPDTLAQPAIWLGLDLAGRSIPQAIAAEGGGNWAPDHTALARADIEAAHALGLTVTPWTVNRAEDMARLRSWGVDGVITDFPPGAGAGAGAGQDDV